MARVFVYTGYPEREYVQGMLGGWVGEASCHESGHLIH